MDEVKENCPHCGSHDLEVDVILFQIKGGTEPPQERKFVYCTNCGHYGDLDTWDNRA